MGVKVDLFRHFFGNTRIFSFFYVADIIFAVADIMTGFF